MIKTIELKTPLSSGDLKKLKVGDQVFLSGTIYTARDQAHKKRLPFDLKGQVVFYAGPVFSDDGKILAIGPTTASRMDQFLEPTLKQGLSAAIGKGPRSAEAKKLFKKYKAVYFLATGGAAALLAQCVVSSKILAYPELGPEAVFKLEVSHFPLVVAIDSSGRDLFKKT